MYLQTELTAQQDAKISPEFRAKMAEELTNAWKNRAGLFGTPNDKLVEAMIASITRPIEDFGNKRYRDSRVDAINLLKKWADGETTEAGAYLRYAARIIADTPIYGLDNL